MLSIPIDKLPSLAIRADEAHHRIVNHTLGSMKPADQNPFRPGAWTANYTCFMPLWNSQYLKIHVNIQSLLHDMIHDYLQNYICADWVGKETKNCTLLSDETLWKIF